MLLAAEGLAAQEIAARIGCSRPSVSTWRRRFEEGGIDALDDAPRSGAPPRIDRDKREEILAATLEPPPEKLGVTHWSSRLLADHVGGVSHMTVARIWAEWGLKPRQLRLGSRGHRRHPPVHRRLE